MCRWLEGSFNKILSFLEISVLISVRLPMLERLGKIITNLQFNRAVYCRGRQGGGGGVNRTRIQGRETFPG